MLIQVHWQYKDQENTEFVAQRDIISVEDFEDWIDELWETHPPPEGAVFVTHMEDSKYFIKTKQEEQ